MRSKQFLTKHWSNILIVAIIALLFIPQTGMPIKVFFNKLIAFSPSKISVEKQETLEDYQWTLKTIAGNETNLASSKGKVALINLWATWCPPCVAEMPSLQNLYNEYGDQVDFYFVSSESSEKLKKFMAHKGYDFPVYVHSYKAPGMLEASSIPTTYVLSKSGKIVIDKTGAANWDSTRVKNLLDELLKE